MHDEKDKSQIDRQSSRLFLQRWIRFSSGGWIKWVYLKSAMLSANVLSAGKF